MMKRVLSRASQNMPRTVGIVLSLLVLLCVIQILVLKAIFRTSTESKDLLRQIMMAHTFSNKVEMPPWPPIHHHHTNHKHQAVTNDVVSKEASASTERDVDEIQLHVITWKRDQQLNDLLHQLDNANYKGWNKPIPLFLHIEGESTNQVDNVAIKFSWSHGQKHIARQSQRLGLRQMWFESIGSVASISSNNTLMVILEDDITVSPAYFQWLLQMIDAYARTAKIRDPNLAGFSLSPILYQTLHRPVHPWNAPESMGNAYDQNGIHHAAYLSVIPSSWGAAYWCDTWKEFDSFVQVRMRPQFYNTSAEDTDFKYLRPDLLTPNFLQIPESLSRWWTHSWKRFMIDIMYARGQVMLYPSLHESKGFATALQEDGEHIPDPTAKNPELATLVEDADWAPNGALPRYDDLFVFGLDLKPTSKDALEDKGGAFLDSILEHCSNNENTEDSCHGINELLDAWAGRKWS